MTFDREATGSSTNPISLQYRRAHELEVGGDRWAVQVVWELYGKRGRTPMPRSTIRFDVELSALDPDWQSAIARARTLGSEMPKLDGLPIRIELRSVDLQFATYEDEDQAEPYGDAFFTASIEAPIPFPRSLHDTGFVAALAKAAAISSGGPIQADEIEERERYWVFPVHNIGANGVIIDRRTGHGFEVSGALEPDLWIWGYEHDLLNEPRGDLIIEQIRDRDRALEALKAFARVRVTDLDQLPLVLGGCAMWTAIRPLHDASDALRWRVEASTTTPKRETTPSPSQGSG